MSLITDLAAQLDTILADPALTSSLRAACPGLDAIMIRADAENARHQRPGPQPLPSLASLTALQMTLFDNGASKRGGSGLAITIEAFTEGQRPGSSRAVTVSSAVLTREALRSRLKRWAVKGQDDWRDALGDVLEAIEGDDWMFVPLTSKAIGMTYLVGQVVLLRFDGKRLVEARLINGAESMTLTAFTNKTVSGKRLSGNAKWSARLCLTGELDGWATQVGDGGDA